MKYEILLFDVDNTLLDFDANEKESFYSLMKEMEEECTEEIYGTYKKLNDSLWKRIEKKEITVSEGVSRRFADLMAMYGKEVDGPLWEKTYRVYLNQGIQQIPDVHQVLQKLKSMGYRLYVITNGVEETQISRMTRSGLAGYFQEMFISGRIGAAKPSREFFDYVKSHIPNFDQKKTLVIGDSLSSDIQGGVDAGLDTCWFHRGPAEMPENPRPDYMIHSLPEVFEIVK